MLPQCELPVCFIFGGEGEDYVVGLDWSLGLRLGEGVAGDGEEVIGGAHRL